MCFTQKILFHSPQCLENKSNNWDVRTRGRLLAALTRSRVSVSGLRPDVVTSAKCQYALLHNDSIRLHHLYMYLASRASTARDLAKVTRHLYSWEMELHRQDQAEVLKCWRLRLGCLIFYGSKLGWLLGHGLKLGWLEVYGSNIC